MAPVGHRARREENAIEDVGRDRRGWALVLAWTLLLAGLLLWPLVHLGYPLGHDMVFTPRQPLNGDAVGLGSAAPRAVPLDALVALAERVVDGAVVGRLALLLPLLAAGLGAAALLRRQPLAARLAAATVAVWNPYVVERLAIGQWALLWCYAALFWLVLAMATPVRVRATWPGRAAALAAASITPTGGLIALAATVTLAATLRRPRREIVASTALAFVLQLPWLIPALVSPAAATSDPAGVAAFAARAEHPGGALLSLLTGGGIWDAQVVPGSRSGALPWLVLALVVAAAVAGARRLRATLGRGPFAALLGLAAAGLLIAWLPALPGGAGLTRAAIAHVPGAGLLRDSQKWILPLVVLEALLVGTAVAALVERVAARSWRLVAALAGALLPVILFPDAAATLRVPLTPVHYPRDWSAVARTITGPGDVAVLPWGSYRAFSWAPGRTVLDPAPRLLPATTIVDDRLVVGDRVLRGESRRADRIRRAFDAGSGLPGRLAAQGIRWVVVEHGTPGRVPALTGLVPVHSGRQVSLFRVPGPVVTVRPSTGRVVAVAVGDALAAAVLLGLAGRWVWTGTSRRKTRRPDLAR